MKIVAKCSAFFSLAYQVHVKVCNPFPLRIKQFTFITMLPAHPETLGMRLCSRLVCCPKPIFLTHQTCKSLCMVAGDFFVTASGLTP